MSIYLYICQYHKEYYHISVCACAFVWVCLYIKLYTSIHVCKYYAGLASDSILLKVHFILPSPPLPKKMLWFLWLPLPYFLIAPPPNKGALESASSSSWARLYLDAAL